MNLIAKISLLCCACYALAGFEAENLRLLEKKGKQSQWVCTKEKAIKYVKELNMVLDAYVELGYMNYVEKITNDGATYAVMRKTEECGCLKQKGCLIPSEFWPCLSSFEFKTEEITYQKNGVVVVSGVESIYVCGKLWFEGKVYRYFVADYGCEYKLEMVLGTDKRCRECEC